MKEASINPSSTLEWIYEYMNNHDRESIQTCIHSKPRKNTSRCIEWVPYNFSFRYIVDHDGLVPAQLSKATFTNFFRFVHESGVVHSA